MPLPKFNDFEISIIGKNHKDRNLNCQDQCFSLATDDRQIGIVADGIGSFRFSEVGSFLYCARILKLLSEMKIETLKSFCKDGCLSKLMDYSIAEFNRMILDKIFQDSFKESFGSTVVLYIITDEMSYIFSKGDGFFGINEALFEIIGNKNYIEFCTFEKNFEIETKNLQSVWVSTDGLRFSPTLKKNLKELPDKFANLFDVIKSEVKQEVLLDDFGLAVSVRD